MENKRMFQLERSGEFNSLFLLVLFFLFFPFFFNGRSFSLSRDQEEASASETNKKEKKKWLKVTVNPTLQNIESPFEKRGSFRAESECEK